VHAPLWHDSPTEQRSPSEQAVPFGAAGFEQTPVLGAQAPATVHGPEAVHTTGFDPVQTPDWQVSVCVQASLSLQVVPLVATGFVQVPVLV
jgi:hypothetical protein